MDSGSLVAISFVRARRPWPLTGMRGSLTSCIASRYGVDERALSKVSFLVVLIWSVSSFLVASEGVEDLISSAFCEFIMVLQGVEIRTNTMHESTAGADATVESCT